MKIENNKIYLDGKEIDLYSTEGFKSVQYDKVVALLVEAIKEQQKQIEQLQQKVKELTEKK